MTIDAEILSVMLKDPWKGLSALAFARREKAAKRLLEEVKPTDAAEVAKAQAEAATWKEVTSIHAKVLKYAEQIGQAKVRGG